MRLLCTGSKLELAEQCVGSAVFDGVETTSEAADLGSAKHAFHYDVLTLGRAAALKRAPEHYRPMLERFNIEALPAGQPGSWAGEVAFALNIETGEARELGRNIGRTYIEHGAGPDDLVGSIDIVGMAADLAALIIDLKTGWTRVSRAKGNLQLLLAAVCAVKLYGAELARGAILYANEDGQPWWDHAAWDLVDLAEAEMRLTDLGRSIRVSRKLFIDGDPTTGEIIKPRLVAGDHCKWCPAINTCPAQGALVRRFIASPKETEEDFKKGLADNDVAAYAYRRLIAGKASIERALSAVYARAAHSPILLANGKVLGKRTTEKEYLVAEKVHAAVTELYDLDAAGVAVEMKATKASINRMARAQKESAGGTIREHEKAVLDVLRARDGVRVKTTESIDEYEPEATDDPEVPALPEGEANDESGKDA